MENTDDEPQHISKSQENFVRDFIKIYKENSILWDKTHPKYKSRVDRDAAFELLANKSREYFPDANVDFVKTKIERIRGTFRKEHKKVLESKEKAKNDEDIYVPALWYYNLLLFTVGEESNEELELNTDISRQIWWTKHYTVTLIELLKKYSILYSCEPSSIGSKSKRNKAYRDITNELIAEVGKHFEVREVKSKITTLKQQFRRENREKEKQNIKKTKLWCYDLLMFLKDSKHTSNPKKPESNNEDEQSISDEDTGKLWINYDGDIKNEIVFRNENQDDIFDMIGKNVAMKLRDMEDDQRIYAENLINEVMYHGLMGNLNADSRISLTGD